MPSATSVHLYISHFNSVSFYSYLIKVILRLYYNHWVYTVVGGLLVPDGIIRLVVSTSALPWFIRYIITEIYGS